MIIRAKIKNLNLILNFLRKQIRFDIEENLENNKPRVSKTEIDVNSSIKEPSENGIGNINDKDSQNKNQKQFKEVQA